MSEKDIEYLRLCAQAFRFVDSDGSKYVDVAQNRTALRMIFEKRHEVLPFPPEYWYELVFRNFDSDKDGLIHYNDFLEICVQYYQHYLKQPRRKTGSDSERGSVHGALSRTSSSAVPSTDKDKGSGPVTAGATDGVVVSGVDPAGVSLPVGTNTNSTAGKDSVTGKDSIVGKGSVVGKEALSITIPQNGLSQTNGTTASALFSGVQTGPSPLPTPMSVSSAGLGRLSPITSSIAGSSSASQGDGGQSKRVSTTSKKSDTYTESLDQVGSLIDHGERGNLSRGYGGVGPAGLTVGSAGAALAAPAAGMTSPAYGSQSGAVVSSHSSSPSPFGVNYQAALASVAGYSSASSLTNTYGVAGVPRIPGALILSTNGGLRSVFDEYEFFDKAGQGSFGRVIVVRSKKSKVVRACKAVSIRAVSQMELVSTELALLKRLSHPNILKLFEIYEDGTNVYMILELCEGGSLADRLANPGSYSAAMALLWVQQLLSALAHCHRSEIIHRDVKPANILLATPANGSEIKLIDFGLATTYEKLKLTRTLVKVEKKSGFLRKLANLIGRAVSFDELSTHSQSDEFRLSTGSGLAGKYSRGIGTNAWSILGLKRIFSMHGGSSERRKTTDGTSAGVGAGTGPGPSDHTHAENGGSTAASSGRSRRSTGTHFWVSLLSKYKTKIVMQRAGTIHYMSPEMIKGEYDMNTDVWSAGVIAFELFGGVHPFYDPRTDDEKTVKQKISLGVCGTVTAGNAGGQSLRVERSISQQDTRSTAVPNTSQCVGVKRYAARLFGKNELQYEDVPVKDVLALVSNLLVSNPQNRQGASTQLRHRAFKVLSRHFATTSQSNTLKA